MNSHIEVTGPICISKKNQELALNDSSKLHAGNLHSTFDSNWALLVCCSNRGWFTSQKCLDHNNVTTRQLLL